MYTIGQLSKKTGVTIRTLDHYDKIGLIEPSSRTEGGHRLYDDQNVMRLEQVLAMKYMNFSLEQIKSMLTTSTKTYKETIKDQLQMVRQEKIRLQALEQALHAVLYSVEFEGEMNWVVIFEIIRLFQQDPEAATNLLQDYLTEEEINQMIHRNCELTNEQIFEWNDTLHEIREVMDCGPTDLEAQRVAKKWLAQLPKLPGNDENMINKVWEAVKAHKHGIAFYPMDAEVIDFLEEVIQQMDGTIGQIANKALEESEKEGVDEHDL